MLEQEGARTNEDYGRFIEIVLQEMPDEKLAEWYKKDGNKYGVYQRARWLMANKFFAACTLPKYVPPAIEDIVFPCPLEVGNSKLYSNSRFLRADNLHFYMSPASRDATLKHLAKELPDVDVQFLAGHSYIKIGLYIYNSEWKAFVRVVKWYKANKIFRDFELVKL